MTISKLLQKGQEILKHDSQTPELDSEILLCFTLSTTKAHIYTYPEKNVHWKQEKKFLEFVNRRKKGAPIAYITKTKEFYSIPFYVDSNVLIPRPETEQLVDLALEEIRKKLKKNKKSIRLIDVGTGCGNIGISIAHSTIKELRMKNEELRIVMADISQEALKIARKNYRRLIGETKNIEVSFVKADLLKGLKGCFDIIVSNPPYIPKGQIDLLDPSVKNFEPRLSLNGGRGGMVVIQRLIDDSLQRLCEGGVLMFEMHEKHPNAIKYFVQEKYSEFKVKFEKDCFKSWRFSVISKE